MVYANKPIAEIGLELSKNLPEESFTSENRWYLPRPRFSTIINVFNKTTEPNHGFEGFILNL